MAKRVLAASLAAPLALTACSNDGALSSDPPKGIELVASGGFTSPMDAVASLDGSEFYFTAYVADEERQPALFKTAARAGSTAEVLAAGDPLESPTGLVLSCDGKTLYAADMGGEDGAIFSIAPSGGALAIPAKLGRLVIERRAQRCIPLDVMTPLQLTAEEARQDQALRPGRLHQFRIVVLTSIEHEDIENGVECGRTTRKGGSGRGRCGRKVREHARVVQQLGGRRAGILAHVFEPLEEETKRLAVRDGQPLARKHGAPSI